MTKPLSILRKIHGFSRRYERTLLWLAILEMFVIVLMKCRDDMLFYTLTAIFIGLNLLPLVAAIIVERARASAPRGRKP